MDPLKQGSLMQEHYCFTQAGNELRESLFHFVTTKYIRTGKFQDRTIGLETEISINGHLLLKVHVTSLEELPKTADAEFHPSILTELPLTCFGSTSFISEQTYQYYSVLAKERNIQGVVVLVGVMDTDGKLGSLEVVESPDQLLGDAVLSKARKERFSEPALRNGEPAPCQFSKMFNFQLSK